MHYSPSVPFDEVPGSLPSVQIPSDLSLPEVEEAVEQALENLEASCFTDNAVWRDWLSITGRVQTRGGSKAIADLWHVAVASRKPHNFSVQPATTARPVTNKSWINVPFTFSTKQSDGLEGICSGTAALTPCFNNPQTRWKIWMLCTVLDQFKDHQNPQTLAAEPHPWPTANSWGIYEISTLIVGAGQAGLSVAGRLAALGLDYVLLERESSVGYGWYGKYDSVKQHTIREVNNLPFDRTWKATDPDLLPAATVVQGFRNYVQKYHINVWKSSSVESCSWQAKESLWRLKVKSGGEIRDIHAKHLVLAMGAGSSTASRPKWTGKKLFRGTLLHSVDYKNSKGWKGLRGIVVGSGTTAHDVAQDMLDEGLSQITMIQRNKTAVYPVDWVKENQARLYNLQIPTAVADALRFTGPEKISHEIMKLSFARYLEENSERFDDLERAGFLLDREKGLLDGIYGRWGGYYIDVGTSARISSREIKIKAGVPVTGFLPDGLAFADDSKVEADVIVLATGYDHDYRNQVAAIVGEEIASELTEFWGVDKNGDLRGVMNPVRPGLWLQAGDAAQARYYSCFVALQIQADALTNRSPAPPVW